MTASSTPYLPGGAAGDPGPLEAPNWPAVPDGTPGGNAAPVTTKQRETLHKFGVPDDQIPTTRAAASDLISKKIEEAEARRRGQG